MNQRSYPYVVSNHSEPSLRYPTSGHTNVEPITARRLSDKASLLRPLQDQHLLEVYREAKKMNLSAEFIELLEEAISMRQLNHYQNA